MKLPIRLFVFGLAGIFAFASSNRPAQAPPVAGLTESASPVSWRFLAFHLEPIAGWEQSHGAFPGGWSGRLVFSAYHCCFAVTYYRQLFSTWSTFHDYPLPATRRATDIRHQLITV